MDESEIFFVESGCAEYFMEERRGNRVYVKCLSVVESGQSFGEFTFFTGKTRNFCVRSNTFTTLLFVKRQDFIDLVRQYPDDYEKFCFIKD